MYNTFRSCIYLFLIVELIMNLPITADNRVTGFILELIARFKVFNTVPTCKLVELICIGVTCIGTRPQKALKYNGAVSYRHRHHVHCALHDVP